MKKLTRNELKNVTGGLQDPPPGCFCFIPEEGPGGGLDPISCSLGLNPELYCPASQLLGCC